jgi:hypothetical protein
MALSSQEVAHVVVVTLPARRLRGGLGFFLRLQGPWGTGWVAAGAHQGPPSISASWWVVAGQSEEVMVTYWGEEAALAGAGLGVGHH